MVDVGSSGRVVRMVVSVFGAVVMLVVALSAPPLAGATAAPVSTTVVSPAPAQESGVVATSATAVALGESHTCAIVAGGQVRCWGDNTVGALGNGGTVALSSTPVGAIGVSGATAIAAGSAHTCVIVAGGQVRCWGSNFFGQLGTGTTIDSTTPVAVPGLSGAVSIAAGIGHTCVVLSSGQARCWGANGSGQLGSDSGGLSLLTPTPVPGLTGASQIAAGGGGHTCVILSASGQVRCWGFNLFGQLGNGTTVSSFAPVGVVGVSGAGSIAAGSNHTCVTLSASGQVRCWGGNFTGQLGDGSTASASTPVAVPGLSGVSRLGAGEGHTCATLVGGTGRCWGSNGDGQLGNGSTSQSTVPVTVTGLAGATRVAAGGDTTCYVVAAGKVQCVGQSDNGQVGTGAALNSLVIQRPLPGLTGATAVELGDVHSCVIVASGQVRCWGDNAAGQLGNGTTADSSTPVGAIGVSGATAIATGGFHTCVIVAGGQVRCWGENSSGQLGNGSSNPSSTPVAVPGLSGAVSIAAGFHYTCVVLSSGQARCWGGNGSGQLGSDSGGLSLLTPTPVPGLTGASQIAAGGGGHTCVILSASGQVRCWGFNLFGQLGNGTTVSSFAPVGVVGVSGAGSIAAGSNHTCVTLSASGQVRCWGGNFTGQLGDGSTASASTPVAVPGLSGVSRLGAGEGHTCATLVGGTGRCWGSNGDGQLGNGSTSQSTVPVTVTGLAGATRVAAGGDSTCAVAAAGVVSCWGDNASGQSGFPGFTTVVSQVVGI